MDDLSSIIKEIKSWNFIKPSDDMVLDVSCRIFISQNIQRDKGFKQTEESKKEVELATPKQLWFFKNNNLAIPKNLSKIEASKIINQYKEGNK
jgi:hypothetical protein